MPVRSPRSPSCSSPLHGRASPACRPHLVGVTTAKDLELLGVLPGLAVPELGWHPASLSPAAGSASMMSMLSSHIPRGGLGSASVASAVRGDNGRIPDGRCHDVSYIRDKPGHGRQVKQGGWSDVVLPASKIPRAATVVETSVLKKNDPSYEEWFEPAERLWHRIVFPAKRPSNREQVLLLERWMTMTLAAHAADGSGSTENTASSSSSSSSNNNSSNLQRNAHDSESYFQDARYHPHLPVGAKNRERAARAVTSSYTSRRSENSPGGQKSRGGGGSGRSTRRAATAAASYTSKNAAAGVATAVGVDTRRRRAPRGDGPSTAATGGTTAEDGVFATAATTAAETPAEEERGAAKIRAQMSVLMVTQHCAERGRLLDRIWRSLNDLFEFVLSEMARTVARCEKRMEFMSRVVDQERTDNENREAAHKNELQLVEELLNGRWSKKLRQLREQEVRYGDVVNANERTVKNIRHWLPSFGTYADSVLSKILPPLPPSTSQGEEVDTPLASPQEALEKDLARIQAAGLWCVVKVGGEDDGDSSDSTSTSTRSESSSDNTHSNSSTSSGSDSGDDKDGGSLQTRSEGTSPLVVRQTIHQTATNKALVGGKEAFVTSGGQAGVGGGEAGRQGGASGRGTHEKERKTKRHKRKAKKQPQQQQQPILLRRGLLSTDHELAPPTTARLATTRAAKDAATSSPPGSPIGAASAARSEKRTTSPTAGTRSKKRGRTDSKMVAVLVQKEQEAAAQAEALTKAAKTAEENAARVAADARGQAKELIQACGRAEEAVLSLLSDPAPTTPWRFPGLLELLGMESPADQVAAVRSSQGVVLGVAGCHSWVISAARALLVYNRESAVSSSASSSVAGGGASATAGVPAASSLLRSRRLAEFLYETELRRSGRVGEARSAVRRLLASLLFWLPPSPLPLPRSSLMSVEEMGAGDRGGAGATATATATAVVAASPTATPRPPGYGKLPRPVAGHEKTALSQFQSLLCARKVGEGISGAGGAVQQDGFSEIEECLWLRVFGAVERHASPCRAEPRQGPTPAHLVPLEKAVAAVEDIFGGEAKSAGMAATTAATTANTVTSSSGRTKRYGAATPWLFVDPAALDDTVTTIMTAAAKHGGNQVELFDVTSSALRVGFRINRETLLRTITTVAEVADLAGELTFATVSVIMHVASPGLPEAALRHLFYRTTTAAPPRASSARVGRRGVETANDAPPPNAVSITNAPRNRSTSKAADGSGGGGTSGTGNRDGEAPSASRLARAVVDYPLACRGLAPLVAATATELEARGLLKQVAYQAKEALGETEKVVSSIKEAQGIVSVEHPNGGGSGGGGGGGSGGGGGGFVPEAEISAVEARAAQLKAFMINADASRSALDLSKLWISRRMLVAETTLLRAYGGVGPTVRTQDAIRQGRRVLLRGVLRALERARREKLMSQPVEETLETTAE